MKELIQTILNFTVRYRRVAVNANNASVRERRYAIPPLTTVSGGWTFRYISINSQKTAPFLFLE